jgi:hypothetical protein
LKKQLDNDNTIEAPELENIFNWDKEQDCYKGQYIDEANKIEYERWPPIEQKRWESFKAKAKDPKSGKWFMKGQNGQRLGLESPIRIVTTIMRLKATDNGAEYLLSNSKIIGYNQFGDEVTTTANFPEKYNLTLFRFETVPDHETGYAKRINTGACGTELIYTLPFTKENALKLFDMRDLNKQNNCTSIQFLVKSEDKNRVYDIQPQITLEQTFKLFVESDFEYLYHANYLSTEQKMLNMRLAEGEGLIPKQTDDERQASILAEQALSQKDKMVSYG